MSKKRKKRKPRRPAAAATPAQPTPAPAPASAKRRRRPAADDRPPAPWGSFPLVELTVLIGIVMLVAGFIVGGQRGTLMIVVGVALASISGLELAIREHFSGFRSHSMLLAGVPAIGSMALLFAAEAFAPVARLAIAAAIFAAAFYGLMLLFRRKAGVAIKLR